MVQRRKYQGSVTFRVQYSDPSGKLKSHTFSKKEDALKFEEKIRHERELVRAGLEVPRESLLLLDFGKKWLKMRSSTTPMSSFVMEETRLVYVLEILGLKPIQFITTKDIRECLDTLQEKHQWKDATRNRCRALLHKMFRDAFMDELIVANPVARIPLLEENPKKKKPLTLSEVELLIERVGHDTEFDFGRLLVTLMVFAGPRISEAVALQYGDIDLQNNEISFVRIYEQESGKVCQRTKGDVSGRIVPLVPRLKEEFLRYRSRTGKRDPEAFIFDRGDGECISTYQGRLMVDRASSLAGIIGITPHGLRATFATLAEESQFSKEEIQKMLGHSSVIVTERYTSMRTNHLKKRVAELGFGKIPNTENVIEFREKSL